MTNENAVKGMSLKKKALIVLCALVSVVVIVATSVLATVAYLTATAAVSNVFTVGNVSLTMDEAKVKPDGTYLSNASERGDTNTYNLVPGGNYIKDPTIHVHEGSQAAYLFITIKNDVSALAVQDRDGSDPEIYAPIAEQLKANGWAKLEHQDVGDIYVYVGVQRNGEGEVTGTKVADDGYLDITATKADIEFSSKGDYKLFDGFSIDKNKTDTELALYASAKITINAFAIQDTGIDTVEEAWEAVVNTYNTYLNIKDLGTGTGRPVQP